MASEIQDMNWNKFPASRELLEKYRDWEIVSSYYEATPKLIYSHEGQLYRLQEHYKTVLIKDKRHMSIVSKDDLTLLLGIMKL